MLAERKVYNKIGIKVYENQAGNNNDNNTKIININKQYMKNIEENINEKLDNQIKNEINREKKKEEFLNEIEKYKEDNEGDDYFNIGKINNKKIKGFDEDIVDII